MSPNRVNPTEARALFEAGVSGAAIGRRYHVSKQAMSKWVRKWRQEAAPGSQPAPAVAPTPAPPPRAEEALLATLRAAKPGLAAIVETHTTIVDRGSAVYLYVKASQPSRETIAKVLLPHRALLASVLGKPVTVAWQ